MSTSSSPHSLRRSVIAIFSGFSAAIVLTVVTDMILEALQVLPMPDAPAPDGTLLLAFGYRTLYAFAACYLTASLTPYRPIAHAVVCGGFCFAASLISAMASWNSGAGFRPYWSGVVLALLVLPLSRLAGWLRWRQIK